MVRARSMLANRLTQRGVAMSGGALAVVLSQSTGSAGMPAAVVSSTIKAASLCAAGKAMMPVKVAALVTVLMGVPTRIEQVGRTGIRELSEEKIRSVRSAGMRYKLVCRAMRRGDGADCRVGPELLLMTDPMAGLEGTSSAIRFDMDVFGMSMVEHNPGVEATGYGLLADFVRAVQG